MRNSYMRRGHRYAYDTSQMVATHNVSRGEGDGAGERIDDKYDGEEYTTKDERADTRTTFYERDIDNLNVSERRKSELRRMLRRQEGEDYKETYRKDEDNREQQNREEWKRRVVTTYASQLSLTDSQKERAKHLVIDVLTINKFGRYATEQVALGVINVVAREDGRWIEDEDEFRDLVAETGIDDMDSLKRLRRMVRERIPSVDTGKDQNIIACPQCEFTGPENDVISHHTKVHKRGVDGEFEVCEGCQTQFYSITQYHQHMSTAHDKDTAYEQKECRMCGDSFKKLKRISRVFCSNDCKYGWISENVRGENHHNWDGGAGNYINWDEEIRKEVIERDNGRCQECGINRDECREEFGCDLHVHHITPRSRGGTDEKENLISLCPVCHTKVENS
jgi:hypothetical protein